MGHKGDWHRPHDRKQYEESWERIFGKSEEDKEDEATLKDVDGLSEAHKFQAE